MFRTLALVLLAAAPALPATYDVVIYGCTSGAITAAVQTRKMGKSVALVCPEKHLGGLTAGGLGWTDSGNKAVIGGLSREFYHRVWRHYAQPAAWKWQPQSAFGNKGQGTVALDQAARTMWIFEPHVAERVYEEWVKEMRIPVFRNSWLDRANGVKKSGGRITSITSACYPPKSPPTSSPATPAAASCLASAPNRRATTARPIRKCKPTASVSASRK